MSKIRNLKTSDIPHLLELSRHAQWNQTAADWERTLHAAGDNANGIEVGGRIISCATAIRYAAELAWIGMVLTQPEHRNQGHATAVLNHTIDEVKNKVGWIKLDATDLGKPVYEKLGFVHERDIHRWRRLPGPVTKISSYLIHEYVVDPQFDRAYFGAFRIPLLNALRRDGEAAFVVSYGYAMSRPGDQARYFGPCVVRSTEAARALLEHMLERHGHEEIYWDLFPDNKAALSLARQYGFEPVRHLTRMALRCSPEALPLLTNESSIFAIAGFEYG